MATTISSKLLIDGRSYEYDLHGDFSWGADEVLYREGADLLENTRLKASGFANIPFLNEVEQAQFRARIKAVINRILAGIAANFAAYAVNSFMVPLMQRFFGQPLEVRCDRRAGQVEDATAQFRMLVRQGAHQAPRGRLIEPG